MHGDTFSSNKPYLFRAIYEWLLDNDATPYMLVNTTYEGVTVPREHIKDEQIVLNINPGAIQSWYVDNDAVSFSARFSGVAFEIYVPMDSIMAIYAQENGLGMAFPMQEEATTELESDAESEMESEETVQEADEKTETVAKPENKGSHLKLIK